MTMEEVKRFMEYRNIQNIKEEDGSGFTYITEESGKFSHITFWYHTPSRCYNYSYDNKEEKFECNSNFDESEIPIIKQGFDKIKGLRLRLQRFIDWEKAKPDIHFSFKIKENLKQKSFILDGEEYGA